LNVVVHAHQVKRCLLTVTVLGPLEGQPYVLGRSGGCVANDTHEAVMRRKAQSPNLGPLPPQWLHAWLAASATRGMAVKTSPMSPLRVPPPSKVTMTSLPAKRTLPPELAASSLMAPRSLQTFPYPLHLACHCVVMSSSDLIASRSLCGHTRGLVQRSFVRPAPSLTDANYANSASKDADIDSRTRRNRLLFHEVNSDESFRIEMSRGSLKRIVSRQ
jgi:hypothetical protein